jgi:hypothetical protein
MGDGHCIVPGQHSKQGKKQSRRNERSDPVQVSMVETFFHSSSLRNLVSKFAFRDLNEISELVDRPLENGGSGQENLDSVERRDQSDSAHALTRLISGTFLKLKQKMFG